MKIYIKKRQLSSFLKRRKTVPKKRGKVRNYLVLSLRQKHITFSKENRLNFFCRFRKTLREKNNFIEKYDMNWRSVEKLSFRFRIDEKAQAFFTGFA